MSFFIVRPLAKGETTSNDGGAAFKHAMSRRVFQEFSFAADLSGEFAP